MEQAGPHSQASQEHLKEVENGLMDALMQILDATDSESVRVEA